MIRNHEKTVAEDTTVLRLVGPLRIGRLTMRRFVRRESGQVLPLFAIMAFFLAQLAFSTYNIGQMVEERIRLQNAADAGAYAEALWEARTLNLMAYMNRANVANTITVFWATTNWAVYELLYGDSSSDFDEQMDINSEIMQALEEAIAVVPIVGAIISTILQINREVFFEILYREVLVNGVYRAATTVFGTLGENLTEGFQYLNTLNQGRQLSAYLSMLTCLGESSIAESVAEKSEVYCEVNSGAAAVNKAANLYRFQTIFAGNPYDSDPDYDRYKGMIRDAMESFTGDPDKGSGWTGEAAAPGTTLWYPLPEPPAGVNVSMSIGHVTTNELTEDTFTAEASAVRRLNISIRIGCFAGECLVDWSFPGFPIDFAYPTEEKETDLDGDAVYRYVRYKVPDEDYLKEPKVLITASESEDLLKDNLHSIIDFGDDFKGGNKIPNGLKAHAAARAIYIGPRANGNPTLFLPYWSARPAQILGFSADEQDFYDVDPMLTGQAAVAAGADEAAAVEVVLEYLSQ